LFAQPRQQRKRIIAEIGAGQHTLAVQIPNIHEVKSHRHIPPCDMVLHPQRRFADVQGNLPRQSAVPQSNSEQILRHSHRKILLVPGLTGPLYGGLSLQLDMNQVRSGNSPSRSTRRLLTFGDSTLIHRIEEAPVS
jgi:hypothetical protein